MGSSRSTVSLDEGLGYKIETTHHMSLLVAQVRDFFASPNPPSPPFHAPSSLLVISCARHRPGLGLGSG